MKQSEIEYKLLEDLANLLDGSHLVNAAKVGVIEMLKHALIQSAMSGDQQ